MKPRDLLLENIKKHLLEPLTDRGFKFATSRLTFSRKQNDFALTIEFSLGNWNREDFCEFWTHWSVSSGVFSKWYRHIWGTEPYNNFIGGGADWLKIPGWSYGPGQHHFILTNSPEDEMVFKRFVNLVLTIGIPHYEQITDWNSAATFAEINSPDWYDRICELYLVANRPEKAYEILSEGKMVLEEKVAMLAANEGKYPQDLREIDRRLDKYFGTKD